MLKERIIEYRANKFREEHGLASTEPVDTFKLLSKLGVLTVFQELGDRFSGMAVKSGTNRYMLVNSTDILARQHFTIGHELYHLFIQENFSNRMCKVGLFDKKDKEEYNADWFSSYLLMPENGIIDLIPPEELSPNKITLNTVVRLEKYFAVSRTAILSRLMFIDLIKKDKFDLYKEQGTIIKSALVMGYTDELYRSGSKGKVIGDYGVRAKRLYDKESISETDFFGLMSDIGIDLDVKLNIPEDAKAAGG